MNKPPSRRKKVIPAASGEPKPATDSAKKDPSSHENPASATITVTAVEILELTETLSVILAGKAAGGC
ncbi:hypothetical protein KBT16_05320 [Nostoc sp. CCCryo 231-06]|nr:hypothetical protein [Nostoc sp. CCCryo 231-06]